MFLNNLHGQRRKTSSGGEMEKTMPQNKHDKEIVKTQKEHSKLMKLLRQVELKLEILFRMKSK